MSDEFDETKIRAEQTRKKMTAAVRLAAAGKTATIAADQANQLGMLFETTEDVLEEIGKGSAQEKRHEMLLRLRTAYDLAKEAMDAALRDAAAVLGS